MEEEKSMEKTMDSVKKESEKIIENIVQDGINNDNIEFLYKLVDIHKDISNEEYWKNKEEVIDMRYRNYGREQYGEYDMMYRYDRRGYGANYGRKRRDSRGRFMERGRDTKYRGEDMMNDMYRNYQDYADGKEEYDRGNYGAKEDTMKSLDYMLESVVCFFDMLKEDANSQEEMDLIKKYARQISEM